MLTFGWAECDDCGWTFADFDAACAECSSSSSGRIQEALAQPLLLTCDVRWMSGALLAEVPFDSTWTVERLAAEVAELAPLRDPDRTHYSFVLGSETLEPSAELAAHLVGERLELHAMAEQLPWCLSPLQSARSPGVETFGGRSPERCPISARRGPSVASRGGVVLSKFPIPWLEEAGAGPQAEGAYTYEVVVDGMQKSGSEGVEVGVTTMAPGDVQACVLLCRYAVLFKPSWVSSDAGTFWCKGEGDGTNSHHYDHEHWRTTRPSQLVVGDVVRLAVMESGAMEVRVNSEVQAMWPNANVPTDGPLYALVGMRQPCDAVSVRLPEKG